MGATGADSQRTWRLGVVSYLNAKPLVAGLDAESRIELLLDVPSRLPDLLDRGLADAALIPVIDLFEQESRWKIVSDACIGCDGETLTVRVFSRVAPESVRRLAADTDSHTSVVLARLIWKEHYGRDLEVVPFADSATFDGCDATLLIGDKVVARPNLRPSDRFQVETDLGAMWKSLVALPLVFAVWAAPHALDASGLGSILSRARDRGVKSATEIAKEYGPALGWPVALAERYLTHHMAYKLGQRQRLGMAKFRELALRHGLLSPAETVVTT